MASSLFRPTIETSSFSCRPLAVEFAVAVSRTGGVALTATEIGAVSVRRMHEVNQPKRAMANAINIEKLKTTITGRYIAGIDGVEGEAELVFATRGAALIGVDHAFTPASMPRTSAAMALVERMIADASANRFTIIPIFPCVLFQF
jgi:predicted GNAT family acetyltransferase